MFIEPTFSFIELLVQYWPDNLDESFAFFTIVKWDSTTFIATRAKDVGVHISSCHALDFDHVGSSWDQCSSSVIFD